VKTSGARILTTLLERQGVATLAGIPGGSNLPLYDALRESRIRHVLARHEQGAGFIAQGMARATGRAGVCLATSGPGATNLLTAIADARLDSVPIVAITGQVPAGLLGTDAFQEVDTYGLTLPITKHNFLVRSPEELLAVVPEAFRIALSGRPGPVAIDVPKDVQTATAAFDAWPEPGAAEPHPAPDPAGLSRLAAMLRRAERPVLYVGGGVVSASAAAPLAALARRNGIPVACTLAALGAFPPEDPLALGMLGMHGARATNRALEEADLLIVAGARFDDRATGRAADFCRRAAVAHLDIDPAEIGKIRAADLALAGDVAAHLAALLPLVEENGRAAWRRRVDELRAQHPVPEPAAEDPFFPPRLLRLLGALAPPEAVVTTDVGQHQMWTAQWLPIRRPRGLLTSGGLGTMGFGLPAAIGAALALPGTPVICVSGDGSLLMNIQELATLAETRLPVKVLLLDNGHLGLVRQQQLLFFGGRPFASRFESRPDFCAIARGFGIPAVDLGAVADVEGALAAAIDAPGPAFLRAPVRHEELVMPMVPPGAANEEMIEEVPVHG
jgi:acetolactate synthase-1/2/3 large subunit